ncbi:MAG TPA: PilZ domain-containing protein [Rhodopseudomonas sp.]|uniref:PilZ domain-containing protein n=1 Tax=Rhodopseudomonas sp. TaxID=1078 RepID=UPI002ED9E25E
MTIDRRRNLRDKVLYGAIASRSDSGVTRDCIVRNMSSSGARLEFESTIGLPNAIGLRIAHKGRSFLANIVWRSTEAVGVAFDDDVQASDLGERLRKSEKIQRALKRKIKMRLGEG